MGHTYKMNRARLDAALQYLNELIAAGLEFPDACGKAAEWYSVEYDALRSAYDGQ